MRLKHKNSTTKKGLKKKSIFDEGDRKVLHDMECISNRIHLR